MKLLHYVSSRILIINFKNLVEKSQAGDLNTQPPSPVHVHYSRHFAVYSNMPIAHFDSTGLGMVILS